MRDAWRYCVAVGDVGNVHREQENNQTWRRISPIKISLVLVCWRNRWAAKNWCERGDSNPHGFPRQILSLVRLPIPPLSHDSIKINHRGHGGTQGKIRQPLARMSSARRDA
jgi:hypothetical protein